MERAASERGLERVLVELAICHVGTSMAEDLSRHFGHEVVAQARRYLQRGAPVGEHLADQLLLPVALVGGRFVPGPLSSHARTNGDTIRAFLLGEHALIVRPLGSNVAVEGPAQGGAPSASGSMANRQ